MISMPNDLLQETCRDCTTAAWVLRRIGFRDNISWGMLDGPNTTLHGFHANSGEYMDFPAEYYTDSKGRKALLEPACRKPGPPQPLCTCYRSELGWLAAGRPQRVTVYMGHPVSDGDFATNIRNAGLWLQYLRSRTPAQLSEITGIAYYQRPLIQAPWLGGIVPDDRSPGGREVVIQDCMDAVLLYDEFWSMVRVTDGMMKEATRAKVVRDLTHLGPVPPITEMLPNPDVIITPAPPLLRVLPPAKHENGVKPKTRKR